jgi:tetratricopeptide (TPR) repeat protein
MIERGRAIAAAAGHLYSATLVEVCHGHVLARAGRAQEAVVVGETAVATCREKNFAGQFMFGACALADAYAARGRGTEAAALAGESIALQEKAEAWSDRSMMHFVRALGYIAAGEPDAAAQDVERALALAELHGERGWEAWAHYAAGVLAHRQGDCAGAEAALDAAQEIAEELGLRPLLECCRALIQNISR